MVLQWHVDVAHVATASCTGDMGGIAHGGPWISADAYLIVDGMGWAKARGRFRLSQPCEPRLIMGSPPFTLCLIALSPRARMPAVRCGPGDR
jgi:hypothetical protein